MKYVGDLAPAIIRSRADRGVYTVGQNYAKGDLVSNAGIRYMATLRSFYAQNFATELAAGYLVLDTSVDAAVVAANAAAIAANTAADAARTAAESAATGANLIGVTAAGAAPALIPAGTLQAALASISTFINDRVLRTGDTMTGQLNVNVPANAAVVLNETGTGILTYMQSLASQNAGSVGTLSNHPLRIAVAGAHRFTVNTNTLLEHVLVGGFTAASYAALVTAGHHMPNRQWVEDNTVDVTGDTMTGLLNSTFDGVGFSSNVGTDNFSVFNPSAVPGVVSIGAFSAGTSVTLQSHNVPCMIMLANNLMHQVIGTLTPAAYSAAATAHPDGSAMINRQYVTDKLNGLRAEIIALGGINAGLAAVQPA